MPRPSDVVLGVVAGALMIGFVGAELWRRIRGTVSLKTG